MLFVNLAECPHLPMTNLLQNSAQFTNSGGRITVRVYRDDGQRLVIVSVADTCVGIDPEFLPRLFSIYTQSDSTLARTGGLGLGLAITKSLADCMADMLKRPA